MTTEAAQRRLLEAISALDMTDGGISGLIVGMQPAIELAETVGSPEMARVFRSISDLASAIQSDRTHPRSSHA